MLGSPRCEPRAFFYFLPFITRTFRRLTFRILESLKESFLITDTACAEIFAPRDINLELTLIGLPSSSNVSTLSDLFVVKLF